MGKTLCQLENHLLHVMREQGVHITPKMEKDIRLTMRAAHRLAFRGMVKQLPGGQSIKY